MNHKHEGKYIVTFERDSSGEYFTLQSPSIYRGHEYILQSTNFIKTWKTGKGAVDYIRKVILPFSGDDSATVVIIGFNFRNKEGFFISDGNEFVVGREG